MPHPNSYPVPYGFKVSVEVVRDPVADIAYVDVIAPIYKNKRWRMPHCYSASQFTDSEILRDHSFHTVLSKHFPA
jgi:hypothetical protein